MNTYKVKIDFAIIHSFKSFAKLQGISIIHARDKDTYEVTTTEKNANDFFCFVRTRKLILIKDNE